MSSLSECKCPVHGTKFNLLGRSDNPNKEEVYLYYIGNCGCKFGCVLTTITISKGIFDLEEIKKIPIIDPGTGKPPVTKKSSKKIH